MKEVEKTYYIIPNEIYLKIYYFIQNQNGNNQELLKLNVNDIHYNFNNAIHEFLKIFQKETKMDDVIDALQQRLDAIKQITFDVCQKKAFHQQNCGNF